MSQDYLRKALTLGTESLPVFPCLCWIITQRVRLELGHEKPAFSSVSSCSPVVQALDFLPKKPDKKSREIATSGLVPDAVEVRRIVSQSDTQVIAETTITLAFQFRRDNPASPWRVAAVRLGDRDWIDLNELVAAINEGRRRETVTAMEKLVAGIASYRQINGSAPRPQISFN